MPPIISIAATAARRGGEGKSASGSIGAAVVCSVRTNAAPSTTAATSAAMVPAPLNPCCWPVLSPKISAAIAAVTRRAPR